MRWGWAAAMAACFVAAIGTTRAQQPAGPRLVAVLEFLDSAGLSSYELQSLSDDVREAALVLPSDRHTVMTRESMTVLLPPGTRLEDCAGDQCEVEIGRRLGADLVVSGTVGRFAGNLEARVKVFDTRRGALLDSRMASAGDLVTLRGRLREEARGLFLRMVGASGGGPGTRDGVVGGGVVEEGPTPTAPVEASRPTDTTGFLFVRTDPEGATVLLDGRELGRAPVQVEVPVGRHVVSARLGRLWHPAHQEVDLGPRGLKVTLFLPPAHGRLEVDSVPRGAEVWIDGEPAGKTPLAMDRKASGTYRVRVEQPDFLPAEEAVTVEDGKTTGRVFRLEPNWGRLRVESRPGGAEVVLNEAPTGRRTPVVLDRVRAGVALVRARLPGHQDGVAKVPVERGQEAAVSLDLVPLWGLLAVTSASADGIPCDGTLSVDGQVMGETPWKGQVLAEVEHEVEVRCQGGPGRARVVVPHQGRKDVQVTVGARSSVPPAAPAVRAVRGTAAPAAPGDRRVRVPLTLSMTEGFLRPENRTTARTSVALELATALRFPAVRWLRPEVALATTVEAPVAVLIRGGIQWYFGEFPMYVRTAVSGVVHPVVRAGFLFGIGGDVPLGKGWYLRLAMEPTVFTADLVPVEFRAGVGLVL